MPAAARAADRAAGSLLAVRHRPDRLRGDFARQPAALVSGYHPQPDVRRQRPGLVHRQNPSGRRPGVLQGRIGPALCQAVPTAKIRATGCDVRSQVRQIHADRLVFLTHHLQFARDANDTLWFSSGGPATCSAGSIPKCSTPLATRRSRRAGLPSSSTQTETASATITSSPISQSIRTRTSASWPACTASPPARSMGRSGVRCWGFPGRSCA